MGSGEKNHFSFHFHHGSGHGQGHGHHHYNQHHHHHEQHQQLKDIPKGCFAVLVGGEGEEKLERFIVPVMYINHPLFVGLLKEAEEEYGFQHKGPITIPCHVEVFRNVQGLIDREHHHRHHGLCFKA